MPLDNRTEKAFDFASECAKQLITLSTGIVALTITFAKDLLGDVPSMPRYLLIVAWFLYLLSIIFGIWMLLALTGTLEPAGPPSPDAPPPSIRGSNVTIPSGLQILSFLLATLFIVLFAIGASGRRPAGKPEEAAKPPATIGRPRKKEYRNPTAPHVASPAPAIK